MFGIDGQREKKGEDFVFELETELKDPKKHREIKKHVEKRIESLKNFLRSGEKKEEFEKFGLILHGYTALLKVIARFQPK
ncbi:MAG: DUF5398 family protein [Waddliaceae bacterium]